MDKRIHKGGASEGAHKAGLRLRKRRRLWLLAFIIISACIIWQVSTNHAVNNDVSAVIQPEAYANLQSPSAETVASASASPVSEASASPVSAETLLVETSPVSSNPGISSSEIPSAEETAETVAQSPSLPEGFVHVSELISGIHIDMRYFGSNNFMGRPAAGYEGNTAILTEKACAALARVDSSLEGQGFGLIIYDAYRPKKAVADFVLWAKDLDDTASKADFYPGIEKKSILEDGYVAVKSSHSRGSTVDLSLVSLETGQPLDMGCSFDFFGKEAGPDYEDLSGIQLANRDRLRKAMEKEGFVISTIEWWHFRLKDEPFPNTSFDFPVH